MHEIIMKELMLRGICFEENVCLSEYSTFKIGGICPLAIFPQSSEEMVCSIGILNSFGLRYKIIGRGSNVLFADKGFDGALIFTKKMCSVRMVGDCGIYAESGTSLECIASLARKHSLTGAEFMHGIPGSCGGAVVMNAGAYGGEISESLIFSDCFDVKKNVLLRLEKNEHGFSYRHSVFVGAQDLIVLGSYFEFQKGDAIAIEEKMKENMASRKAKQPLEYPNAGSIFKRPKNDFAARMIDECGLKGHSVGGAMVSPKHAGFIINQGGATAKDVLELSEFIRDQVKARFGVELQYEIQYVE